MIADHLLVHVEDVAPERMEEKDGWAISTFRLPISGRDGSSTTVFHAVFRPGSTHARHVHTRCNEIAVYLTGNGVVGQGSQRCDVRAGHCRLVPQGAEHFFFNETADEDMVILGFYEGAADVEDTGYGFRGPVTPEDLAMPRVASFREGILVDVADVAPTPLPVDEGWGFADLRLPLHAGNGSPTALYWATLQPGDVHGRHRYDRCDEIYYVASGRGVATVRDRRMEVRAGHLHLVRSGVEHSLENAGTTEPLVTVGILLGAASVEASGYVFTGVTAG